MGRHRLSLFCTSLLFLGAMSAIADDKVGTVKFETSCSPAVQADFERAVAMLHSFWFSASTDAFVAISQKDPGCAMAHWGVAMNRLGNPFAWPPPAQALSDGAAAIARAKAVGAKTQRERDYIDALEYFYRNADTVDHRFRASAYRNAMERLAARYHDDREASISYALALNGTANPADKGHGSQLMAAAILEKIFAEQPQHPGVAHYLIHSYDYPPIADRGLNAARRYASIAPAAPHALHMPSHIFTRRGYWQESIDANRASANATGNQFDQLHALDYLVYAHLQMAQDASAKRVVDYVSDLPKVSVEHFVTGFALATIPSRYALERGRWTEAAKLGLRGKDFPWARFPQSEAQLVFARALGAARSGDVATARRSADRLGVLRDALATAKADYWSEQVDIQRQIALGWVARAEGKNDEALALLRAAAEREGATEKHPVTPGPLAPARELLAEMLLEANEPAKALQEFESSMRGEPNRFRGLACATRAAELAGDRTKARTYAAQLAALGEKADSERPELARAKTLLAK